MTDIPVARAKIDRPDATIVRLPSLPPSVNELYFNRPAGQKGKGRVPTDRYTKWQNDMGFLMNRQRSQFRYFRGPVNVSVTIAEPSPACDIDNRLKGLLDLCVKYGALPDDNSKVVRDLRISISDDPAFEGVEVRIEPRRAG